MCARWFQRFFELLTPTLRKWWMWAYSWTGGKSTHHLENCWMKCSYVKWQFLTHAGNALLFIFGGRKLSYVQNTSPMELLFVQHGKSLGKSCLKGLRFFPWSDIPAFHSYVTLPEANPFSMTYLKKKTVTSQWTLFSGTSRQLHGSCPRPPMPPMMSTVYGSWAGKKNFHRVRGEPSIPWNLCRGKTFLEDGTFKKNFTIFQLRI